ncbi:MAG: PLP-dependent aminotransferase family protein [Candidatus Eisenbacteria bacterium]|nr:PLP-dependent aminotransferase family protein [Candidatus Eisenbacteria bacterium]
MDDTYLQRFLSDSARRAKRSEIRELLKLTARPEVISLAGGLPAPETFPLEEIADLLPGAMREFGANALQYGTTEGDNGLKDEIIKMMADDGLPGLTRDEVMITTASQQGLDLVSRVFLAPGDAMICGLPSYLGALSAFNAAGALMTGIPLDDDGMPPDALEEQLKSMRERNIEPKLLYLVPDFQNPAGVTLSFSRRQKILKLARKHDMLVLEDSPYRQLRYTGENVPSMKSMDEDGRVISLFTFSKILFPGLRLGWAIAHPDVISRLVVAKQSVDLCTSALSQLVAREYLKTGRLPAQLERTRAVYRDKCAVILKALDDNIDPSWGVKWTRPEGGLFLWMTLPDGLNAKDLLAQALQENVAFVIGNAFYCDGGGSDTMRLNFSFPSQEQLKTGIARIAKAIKILLEKQPA